MTVSIVLQNWLEFVIVVYSFEDMRVFMLCEFGLKMRIHASFGGVCGVKIEVNLYTL